MRRSTELPHTTDPATSPAGEGGTDCTCYFDEDGNMIRDPHCPYHGW